MKERLPALAVLTAGVALAWVLPPSLAIVALIATAGGVVLGPRFEVDRLGQTALTFLAALLGVLLPRLLVEDTGVVDPALLGTRRLLLGFPVLLVAAGRVLVAAPRFGTPLTLVAALGALVAAGGARTGLPYPLLSALFLALALASLSAADPHRAPLRQGLRSGVLVTVVAVLLSATAALASTRLLPPLHDAMMERFLEHYRRSRIGFSDRLALGELGALFADDSVVLRLRGRDVPELLRGAAFTEYVSGGWRVSGSLPPPQLLVTDRVRPRGDGWLELETARSPRRYFLPLSAREVSTSTGQFTRDAFGIHRPVRGSRAKRIWFRADGRLPLREPGPEELILPSALRRALLSILEDWGALEGAPGVRLDRIQRRLRQDYGYTVQLEWSGRSDPVVEFLVERRAGHCEYFASALALLARAAGVPTRLVSGYRVVEQSRFGYHVVRERHAHAWVEAWVNDQWVTFDPTPPSGLATALGGQTPLWSSLGDLLATSWEAADDWLGERTVFDYGLALVLLGGGLMLYRVLRGRRASGPSRGKAELPLRGFAHLSASLGRRGLHRAGEETLECFTRRIETSDALEAAERQAIASLIREYARLRYAGQGDGTLIEQRLAATAAEVGRGTLRAS